MLTSYARETPDTRRLRGLLLDARERTLKLARALRAYLDPARF